MTSSSIEAALLRALVPALLSLDMSEDELARASTEMENGRVASLLANILAVLGGAPDVARNQDSGIRSMTSDAAALRSHDEGVLQEHAGGPEKTRNSTASASKNLRDGKGDSAKSIKTAKDMFDYVKRRKIIKQALVEMVRDISPESVAGLSEDASMRDFVTGFFDGSSARDRDLLLQMISGRAANDPFYDVMMRR
jgi:hypothetical protein